MIRVGRTGNDGLTQARIGIDHRLTTFPGEGIGREEDASHLGLHHPLHHDGQAHVPRSNAQAGTILRGAVRPQRRKTPLDGGEHRLAADHIEKGLLLPGKGGLWQIFGGRRGTDGDWNRLSRREGLVCRRRGLDHLWGKRCLTQSGADGCCQLDLTCAFFAWNGLQSRKIGVEPSTR